MADTAQNLRTLLTGTSAVSTICGAKVHQGTVPESDVAELPYLWMGRSSRKLDRVLSEAQGAASDEEWFDVEAISDDLDEAQRLADAVRTLDNFRGTMGTQTIKGLFLNDQDDNYVPRGTLGETELHVAALAVQIFT